MTEMNLGRGRRTARCGRRSLIDPSHAGARIRKLGAGRRMHGQARTGAHGACLLVLSEGMTTLSAACRRIRQRSCACLDQGFVYLLFVGKESTAGERRRIRRTAGSGPRELYFRLAFDLYPTNGGSTEAGFDLPQPSFARHRGVRFSLPTVFCSSLGIV